MHAPAFVVLGPWALVLMFRDNSRELEFVRISDIWTGSALLLVIRLPFRMSMAVHVRGRRARGAACCVQFF